MEKQTEKFKQLAVLVVDDMEAIRFTITECLKDLGVTRHYNAANGNLAWKQLQEGRIDLIICDWGMPQVSGIELLKLVRESEQHKHIPFLMLTAETDKKSVMEAISAGANDYMTKPFQPKVLETRIVKQLQKILDTKPQETHIQECAETSSTEDDQPEKSQPEENKEDES